MMSSGLKAVQSHTCKGPAAGGTGNPLFTTSCTSLPRDTFLSIHPISPDGRAQLECLFNAGSFSPEKAVVCTGGHSRVSSQEALTRALYVYKVENLYPQWKSLQAEPLVPGWTQRPLVPGLNQELSRLVISSSPSLCVSAYSLVMWEGSMWLPSFWLGCEMRGFSEGLEWTEVGEGAKPRDLGSVGLKFLRSESKKDSSPSINIRRHS